jgi:hypothetical protein
MPDLFAIFLIAALGCGLLLVLLLVALRISGRLGRIERLLAREATGEAESPLEVVGRSDPQGSEAQRQEFEEFLEEDKSRRKLPKKEQFAAYRAWRKQRGLTWGS